MTNSGQSDLHEEKALEYYRKLRKSYATKTYIGAFFGLFIVVGLLGFVSSSSVPVWLILTILVVGAVLAKFFVGRALPSQEEADASFSLMHAAMEHPMMIRESSLDQTILEIPPRADAPEAEKSRRAKLHKFFHRTWLAVFMPEILRAYDSDRKEFDEKARAAHRRQRELDRDFEKKQGVLDSREEKINAKEAEVIKKIKEFRELEKKEQQGVKKATLKLKDYIKPKGMADYSHMTAEELATKALELKHREEKVEKNEKQLEEDRTIVEQQKTELNQMKGEFLAEPGHEDESRITAQQMEIDELKADLLERSSYIEEVENQMIIQLQVIAEREAAIEQREISAGIRSES